MPRPHPGPALSHAPALHRLAAYHQPGTCTRCSACPRPVPAAAHLPCLLTTLAPYTKSRALTRPPAPSAVTPWVRKAELERRATSRDSVSVVFHCTGVRLVAHMVLVRLTMGVPQF